MMLTNARDEFFRLKSIRFCEVSLSNTIKVIGGIGITLNNGVESEMFSG